MDSGEKVRYRLTHWPGSAAPVPAVLRLHVWLVEGQVLLFGLTEAEPLPTLVDPPDELYLRGFLSLDVSDPQAALAFCAQYGMVGSEDMTDLGGFINQSAMRAAYEGTGLATTTPRQAWRALSQDVDPSGWFNPEHARKVLASQGVEPLPLLILASRTLAELGTYQAVLGEMVRLWRVIGADSEAVAELPYLLRFSHSGADDDALAGLINPALTPFHVRLNTGSGQPLDVDAIPNLYQAMCLQLANHIAESAAYKRCAECESLFVRKQDRRYRKGQQRMTGGRFCSDTCEDRWHQREYRRKKREQRQRGES